MMLDLPAIAERRVRHRDGARADRGEGGVIFALARLFGMAWRGALALGLCSARAASSASSCSRRRRTRAISPEAASLFGAVVTLSMATTPS